ncbi:MAG: 4-hydroxy-tetrahydrodipicolinate synthase [Robiginitalea sp.]
MNEKFYGTGIALITPFNESLEPDFEALERLVEYVVTSGVDYLVVLGTTGESATLSKLEKASIFKAVRTINKGRLPLMAGIGGNDTRALVNEFKQTDLTGYDAILSVSPYYNKPSQEGIYRHYRALAEASPLPLLIYNVPSRTGSNLLPGTVLRIAASTDKVIGIKEASGDMQQIKTLIEQAPEGFLVISGDDHTAVATILEGGSGVISVVGQGIPETFTRMIRMAMAGEAVKAERLHRAMIPLFELLFKEGNPAGIKGLLAQKGICLPGVRLPLIAPSTQLQKEIEAYLKEAFTAIK